jgi:hypothetical protein
MGARADQRTFCFGASVRNESTCTEQAIKATKRGVRILVLPTWRGLGGCYSRFPMKQWNLLPYSISLRL